ncbi:xanthine dehydrogenase family protein molybdopterin-binding subunit [Clostridium hydrogeniformans]|uniref:xanthine dehydrogenase family protein molybdopterin-binding subunit n=1 Tax=Clostridium hydrogeniformans TaxID=349933 RepID=UPI0004844E43|nr:molybdopterin cofactor-binding domain-containing protein [Clostridium hydrogeniformans]
MIGDNIKKIDAMAITTGKPVYTDDLAMKDALVVKLLRSPHSFAKILDIDIEKALKVEGVECILTHKDVPKERFTLAGQSYPEPSPYDRLILDEIVRYVGDEVAIIAAKDEKTALKAMEVIKVKYEVYEPVLDFEKAEGNDSVVHEEDVKCNFNIGMEKEKNIASKEYVEYGDVDEELKKCDYVVEETYYTQAQSHCMMETYRAFNYMDHMGRLVVVTSTQIPFHVKRHLSRALQIPGSKIRVIKPRIGGGFGGKQTACVEIFTAIVTLKTGKPAKLIYDRKETFQCSTSRHAMRFKVRIGANKEGYIKAIDIEGLSDTGAYGEHCSTVFGVVGEKTITLYNKINAGRYHGKVVYTNKVPAGAFRGYGATQGCFAIECAVNELAEKLNMDPIDIRLKNLCKEGEMTYPYKKVMTSSTLHQCIEKGKELIKWDEKYPCVSVGNNKVRSVGMAVTMQGSGIAGIDTSSAEIRLSDSGEYILFIGSTDMGTGSDTILAQMAAEILETTVDNIVVIASDTDVTPYDPGSYASSTTYVTGMAVVKAAENLKNKIISKSAENLDVDLEEVIFQGNKVSTLSGKSISLKNLAEGLTLGPRTEHLTGIGSHGSQVSPPPFIAGFVEIELDKETGGIEVIDYIAVVDCGTIINPNLARVQVEGGIVQGIGMALYEDVHYNPTGKLDTNTFMQYKIPNRKDIGNIIVDFVPSFEKTGPFGAKSVGEVVVNTPSPAIAHAVYNGGKVNVRSLPITSEKVFCAMINK